MALPPGLYESIVTAALQRQLGDDAETRVLGASEAARRLAEHFGAHLERALNSIPKKERPHAQVELVNELLAVVERHAGSFPVSDDGVHGRLLTAVRGGDALPLRPQLPLSESGLYVNANRERSLEVALKLEIESADRIDLICAFLFWEGYRPLRHALSKHLELGRSLRILTTTYRAITQPRVLDELESMGARVRISYETGSTRLHAKSWLFHRDSGFSTAYVGSSNLSRTALTSGREWNVRLSQIENGPVVKELGAAFENYWEEEEFVAYDKQVFAETLRAERPKGELRAVFKLTPRTFQKVVLERLDAERELHNRHSNLVVSATGTGKTVIAALDYARLVGSGKRLKLLFVAHRKEILTQSRDVFRHAMSDGSFGELYVDGDRPLDWTHVFASVQSLSRVELEQWPRDHFDVIIVDEFHHAAAATYVRLLEYFRPRELLGLTATPERTDRQSVLSWFEGRIASELRIWDAIERGLLVPFQYFGVYDNVDLRSTWHGGGYDAGELDNLYTGRDARAHLIVEALRKHIRDPHEMRALAFCAGVNHAQFMADTFTCAGLNCAVVVGGTSRLDRRRAIKELRDGTLSCIFSVDVFNEGVDIPEVDTILFLRPTESATVFLQQLGRGLRTCHGKRCLTVLDFVGLAHERFRYVERFRALLGPVGRKQLKREIEDGFPLLPQGCSIELDRVSQEVVLDNVARSLRLDRRSLGAELKDSGETTLAGFLVSADLALEDLYRSGRTFTELKRIAGLPCEAPGPLETKIGRGVGRLLHVDDRARLAGWLSWLSAADPTTGLDERLRCMLLVTLLGADIAGDLAAAAHTLWQHTALREELVELLTLLGARLTHNTLPWVQQAKIPLLVHGTYRLQEIMSAMGDVREGRLYLPREGVQFDVRSQCNLLFVTLHKEEDDYSPTTMYADYALSATRFHWQSQSGTRPNDAKGRRHLDHASENITPLLFVRPTKVDDRGETMPYTFLGPVKMLEWSGERPMNVEWQLDVPMPAATLKVARVVG
jgi:superfamily II DNA or RNA helicase